MGLETERSSGAFWMRNLGLMRAVAAQENIKFVSIIQPVVGVGGCLPEERQQAKMNEAYLKELNESYELARKTAAVNPSLADFSQILGNCQGYFYDDARHLFQPGNRKVAQKMLELLNARRWLDR